MQGAFSDQMNRSQEMLRAAGNFAIIADYEHARSHGRPSMGCSTGVGPPPKQDDGPMGALRQPAL